jgi:hypothetical protein
MMVLFARITVYSDTVASDQDPPSPEQTVTAACSSYLEVTPDLDRIDSGPDLPQNLFPPFVTVHFSQFSLILY